MSAVEHSTLVQALEKVLDPRDRRGVSYEWRFLLVVIAMAMLAGCSTPVAMGRWVNEHRVMLLAEFKPKRLRVPSLSTLRRALQRLDIAALEAAVGAYQRSLLPETGGAGVITTKAGEQLQAVAVDGKAVRGASAHGAAVFLVSMVCHASGLVLDQLRTEAKKQERRTAQALLDRQPLKGYVITLDALHTCPQQADQIWMSGAHYLMVVKGNRRTMHQDLIDTFAVLPPTTSWEAEFWQYECEVVYYKGHGRYEIVILESTPQLNGETLLPASNLVLQRTRIVVTPRTGKQTVTVEYLVTSLSREQVSLAQIEQLRRGHWTIENKTHYVRDVTFGEDRCQVRKGAAPQALAALRNAIVALVRLEGWSSIPAALSYFNANPHKILQAIGAIAT